MSTKRIDLDITPRKVKPTEMGVEIREGDKPKLTPGRRKEIQYVDLGLESATKGELRGEKMQISVGVSQPTGWHYHECDIQFLHMIKGWVKMEFPDTGVMTLKPGDSISIPGGVIHQELCSSDDMELIEVTVPAKIGTVNVEAPDWGKEKASDYSDKISKPI